MNPMTCSHGGGDGGGAPGLEPAAAGPFGGFLAGAAFGGGGPFQRRRPVAGGRELFLGAAQGEPGLHLGRAGQRGGQGQGVPVFRGRFLLRGGLLGRGEPGRHRFQRILLADNLGLSPWPGTRPAAHFRRRRCAAPRSGGPGVRRRPRVSRRIRGVSSRAASARSWASARRVRAAARAKRLRSSAAVTAASFDAASSTAAWTSSSDGADAEPPVTVSAGEDVPGPGHGGQLGTRGDQLRRGIQVLDDGDAGQQVPAAAGRRRPVPPADPPDRQPSARPREACCRRDARPTARLPAAGSPGAGQQQRGTAGVVVLEQLQAAAAASAVLDQDGVGALPECGGDGGLETGLAR